MRYDMLKELLDDENISSLTLHLVNSKKVKVFEYDKDKSNNTCLFVTKPNTVIISLTYVVNVDVHFPIDFDALDELNHSLNF